MVHIEEDNGAAAFDLLRRFLLVVFIILLGLTISRISTVFEVTEDLPTLGVRTGFLMQWVNGKEWGFVSLYMTQFLDDFGGGFQGGFSIIGIVTAYCIFGISAWTAFGQTMMKRPRGAR
mgnify:CR=1 FL=1